MGGSNEYQVYRFPSARALAQLDTWLCCTLTRLTNYATQLIYVELEFRSLERVARFNCGCMRRHH